MSIYGYLDLGGRSVPAQAKATLTRCQPSPEQDETDIVLGPGTALGRQSDPEHGLVSLVATARLDNRGALISILGLTPEKTDDQIVVEAYGRWGKDCVHHLQGDWCFAAWHHGPRRLILARDHLGTSALFYHAGGDRFIFSPDRHALLALTPDPPVLDEEYLARLLVSWRPYPQHDTAHTHIKRLPAAHVLIAEAGQVRTYRYWTIETIPRQVLSRREDYVERFLELFDGAVRRRLDGGGAIGGSLSGGLDSSSVCSTAAAILHQHGRRLSAFTLGTTDDTSAYVTSRIGNEVPYAEAVCQAMGNIDLYPIGVPGLTPLQGITSMLGISPQPQHAAVNLFWIVEMAARARDIGCRVVLTGQLGNGGISWDGGKPLSSWHGVRSLLRDATPRAMLRQWKRLRLPTDWYRHSAITPVFAKRMKIAEQMLAADCSPLMRPTADPLSRRLSILLPNGDVAADFYADIGRAYGLEFRDPTSDIRLLEFVLSIPNEIFLDPLSGMSRWLIRSAMAGRLPDMVRLNTRRGRQSADLVPRLRRDAVAMEATLAGLEHSPAADYVDVPYMKAVWRTVLAEDSPASLGQATSVLLRGVMAGLFVNQMTQRR